MDTAFKFGMDRFSSATVTFDELKLFCDDMDFSGNPRELFDALDEHQHGFITIDELDFLSKWQGERFVPGQLDREYNFGLARLRIAQTRRRTQRQKMEAERMRATQESERVSMMRSLRTSTALTSLPVSPAASSFRD